MGLADLFSDLYSALTFTDVHAEEPAPEQQEEGEEDEKSEEGKEGGEDHEQEESQKGGDDEDGAEQEEESQEEEEEEEEEEPVDPKPRLEEGMCRHNADLPSYNTTTFLLPEAVGDSCQAERLYHFF